MSDETEGDAREWEADKREFVADHRDDLAAARDAAATTRDRVADGREHRAHEREAGLDERQRRLDARAVELGAASEETPEAKDLAVRQRAEEVTERESGRNARESLGAEREEAVARREEADKQRHASSPATGLAVAFAEIARYLYEADNFEDVLMRVVETAVATVSGCAMSSVTVRDEDGAYRTVAATDDAATAVDLLQYEANEGPCLDAVVETLVHAPSLPDPRWPALGARPLDAGVHGVASYHLDVAGAASDGGLVGSLNDYARARDAFDDDAIEIGLILAAHASVAVSAVRARDAADNMAAELHAALSSRDVISQAKGILMERLGVTPDDAFDILRRSSQQLNVKLRETAQRLAETGQLGGTELG